MAEAAQPSALPLDAARDSGASIESVPPPSRTSRRQDAPAPVAAPEDLLRKANALRAGGRWKEAEALYLRIIRAEPSSLASYVARVASGSLRLEHLGDARGALRHFQEALRLQPQGVLGQEARHGIAEAHRALGDSPAEARALEAFLSSHPDSPLATTARARLRELSRP
ncbi:tetratricopeptide repeat protein [Pyxidicoccus sp. 3LG]